MGLLIRNKTETSTYPSRNEGRNSSGTSSTKVTVVALGIIHASGQMQVAACVITHAVVPFLTASDHSASQEHFAPSSEHSSQSSHSEAIPLKDIAEKPHVQEPVFSEQLHERDIEDAPHAAEPENDQPEDIPLEHHQGEGAALDERAPVNPEGAQEGFPQGQAEREEAPAQAKQSAPSLALQLTTSNASKKGDFTSPLPLTVKNTGIMMENNKSASANPHESPAPIARQAAENGHPINQNSHSSHASSQSQNTSRLTVHPFDAQRAHENSVQNTAHDAQLLFNPHLGKETQWQSMRSYFSQMLQGMLSLSKDVQELLFRTLSPNSFLLDSQGNVRILLPNPTQHPEFAALYAAPEGESGLKAAAFTLGLLLLQMSTGKRPDEMTEYSSKTYRQEILEGRLLLPSHIPEDLQMVLQGLLHPNPTERLALQLALKMLQMHQSSRTSIEQRTFQSTFASHPVATAVGVTPGQVQPSSPQNVIIPYPHSPLLLSNHSIAKEASKNAKEEREDDTEEGNSIQAVIFNWETVSDTHDEIVEIIRALQASKIKVGLLSHQKDSVLRLLADGVPSSSLTIFSPEHLDKPNPKAYEAFVEEIAVPPTGILIFHNKQGFVQIARQMGLHAALCSSTKEIKEELKKRNLLF